MVFVMVSYLEKHVYRRRGSAALATAAAAAVDVPASAWPTDRRRRRHGLAGGGSLNVLRGDMAVGIQVFGIQFGALWTW